MFDPALGVVARITVELTVNGTLDIDGRKFVE